MSPRYFDLVLHSSECDTTDLIVIWTDLSVTLTNLQLTDLILTLITHHTSVKNLCGGETSLTSSTLYPVGLARLKSTLTFNKGVARYRLIDDRARYLPKLERNNGN